MMRRHRLETRNTSYVVLFAAKTMALGTYRVFFLLLLLPWLFFFFFFVLSRDPSAALRVGNVFRSDNKPIHSAYTSRPKTRRTARGVLRIRIVLAAIVTVA